MADLSPGFRYPSARLNPSVSKSAASRPLLVSAGLRNGDSQVPSRTLNGGPGEKIGSTVAPIRTGTLHAHRQRSGDSTTRRPLCPAEIGIFQGGGIRDRLLLAR